MIVAADTVEAVISSYVLGVDQSALLEAIIAFDYIDEMLIGHFDDLTVGSLNSMEATDLIRQAMHEGNDRDVGSLKISHKLFHY